MSQSSPPSPAYLAKLRRNLASLAEIDLREFCFDHGIEYDNLPTMTISVADKARALVEFLNQRGRVAELVAWGQDKFPNLNWQDDGSSLSPPSERRPLRVFMCHSSKDKATVGRLYQRLKAQGIQPWLDEEDILPGQDWDREIRKAVAGSDAILVCLSRNSTSAKGYLQREIQSVLDAADEQPKDSIFVIPLKLEECAVPEHLSKWQWVNYFDARGYARLMRAFDERAKSVGADFVMPADVAQPIRAPSALTRAPSSRRLALGSAAILLLIVVAAFLIIRSASNQFGTLSPPPSSAPTDPPQQARITDAPTIATTPEPTELPTLTSSTSAPTLTLGLAPGVQMEFVRVPAGEFLMGSDPTKDQSAQADEQPQHRMDLSEYFIGKHEVTNAQYAVFAKERDPSWQMPIGKENHPVVNVAWNDVVAFTEWMSDKTGKTVALPTEAEWEKACRSEDGRIYPWGDLFDAQKLNSFEGGAGGTTPIGQYSPAGDSPYGAADMSGNVWEWTADWYDENAYKGRSQATAPVKGPAGPNSGTLQVLRGGAFRYHHVYARCASRLGDNPDNLFPNRGFRVVVRAHLS